MKKSEMKRMIFVALMATSLMPTKAQDYTIINNGIVTEVKFYSPDIVRVTKYQKADALSKTDPKVVVTMTPQEVNPTKKEGSQVDTLLTDKVMVTCNKLTGVLGFFRPDGTVLIKETYRSRSASQQVRPSTDWDRCRTVH